MHVGVFVWGNVTLILRGPQNTVPLKKGILANGLILVFIFIFIFMLMLL